MRSSARSALVAIVLSQALTRSGGSSLTLLDLDRLRARAGQLAPVLVGDERRVGVRRQQLLRDVVPHRLEAFRAAERRRGHVVVREREQALLLVPVVHERLERLREPIGRRAFRDDVARDEARDGAVGHPADDRLHDSRSVVLAAGESRPSSISGVSWPTAVAMLRRTGSS